MIFCIVGPTASGKSSFGIELAKKTHGAILCGDAFQVYQDLQIGTAKPTIEERALVPHYLFDFVSPSMDYSVMQYQKDLRDVLEKLKQERTLPIIVGGTGLYLRAGLYDYTFQEEPVRLDMSQYEAMDNDTLFSHLQAIDEEEAKKLHPNNRKRVLRAIEIYLSQGKTKTEILQEQKHELLDPETYFIGLKMERSKLYQKIDERVIEMLSNGWIEEVKRLKKTYPLTAHAFQAIGYREIMDYLDGKIEKEEMTALIQKKTRNYAKRQMTFFSHQFPVIWFEHLEEATAFCLEKIQKKGQKE